MNPTSVVLVSRRNGKLLLVSRKNNFSDFGFIGGKVDPGEDLETALRRETFEESGLGLTNIRHLVSAVENGYPIEVFTGDVIGEFNTKEKGVLKWGTWQDAFAGSFGVFNRKIYKKMNL